MSSAEPSESEEARRARKLEAAKKKLKTFRASRSSPSTSSTHSKTPSMSSIRSTKSAKSTKSISRSPVPSSALPPAILPLSSDSGANASHTHLRSGSAGRDKGKGKAVEVCDVAPSIGHVRQRSGSKASGSASGGRHRRQQSSISGNQAFKRPSVIGVFDTSSPLRGESPSLNFSPPVSAIVTTPATPLTATENSDPFAGPPLPLVSEGEEDPAEVKRRMSTFSFGAKPPSLALASPSRSPATSPRRGHQRGMSSMSLRAGDAGLSPFPGSQPFLMPSHSPLSSPATSPLRSSTSLPLAEGISPAPVLSAPFNLTPSRPPSLLFTKASPLTPASPAAARVASADPPSAAATPGTPSRRRHTHTRSNSISMPHLLLNPARPSSLGILASPSFPSSPCSPSGSEGDRRPSVPSTSPGGGRRLKFEPSPAEVAKEESRRKALEKLVGSASNSPPAEEKHEEIALPDLDDDTSSTTSSSRPISGIWGPQLGFGSGSSRPWSTSSSGSAPSPFPWMSEEAVAVNLNTVAAPKERMAAVIRDERFGAGFEVAAKRGSLTNPSTLTVLQEEDETEEEGEANTSTANDGNTTTSQARSASQLSPPVAPAPAPASTSAPASRLRELHLVPSASFCSPVKPSLVGTPMLRQSSTSPTKGYGAIGRGRPRPLSGLGSSSFGSTSTNTPINGKVLTPQSAKPGASKRRLSNSSRRSSISYKPDRTTSTDKVDTGSISSSISSTSRWSLGSKSLGLGSPPMVFAGPLSPPLSAPSASPRLAGSFGADWTMPRGTGSNRPCPRSAALVGLGIEASGSANRVLSEVLEREEPESLRGKDRRHPSMGSDSGWASAPTMDRPFTFHPCGSSDDFAPVSATLDAIDTVESGDRGVRSSEEMDRDSDEGMGRWRDILLEVEMERDALREDVESWRERYRQLEEKLDVERRDSTMLRDRVRKLSDRLSAASSMSPNSPNQTGGSRVMREMQDQLFNLTASLDQERRDKAEAHHRIRELERTVANLQSRSSSPGIIGLPPSPYPAYRHSPAVPSSPIVTPATPLMPSPHAATEFSVTPSTTAAVTPSDDHSQAADQDGRMRAWGFPSASRSSNYQPTPFMSMPRANPTSPSRTYSKRDSFFNLSNIPLRPRPSVSMDEDTAGIDLPPFVVSSGESVYVPPMIRAVSSPTPWMGDDSESIREEGQGMRRSISEGRAPLPQESTRCEDAASARLSSASSTASAALSFLTNYLPLRSSSPTKSVPPASGSMPSACISSGTTTATSGRSITARVGKPFGLNLDFRGSCKCCQGDLMEL